MGECVFDAGGESSTCREKVHNTIEGALQFLVLQRLQSSLSCYRKKDWLDNGDLTVEPRAINKYRTFFGGFISREREIKF